MSGGFRSEAIEQFSIKGLVLKFGENSARTFTRKLIVACLNRSRDVVAHFGLLRRREGPCLSWCATTFMDLISRKRVTGQPEVILRQKSASEKLPHGHPKFETSF